MEDKRLSASMRGAIIKKGLNLSWQAQALGSKTYMVIVFSGKNVLKGFGPMFKVVWNEQLTTICVEKLWNKFFGLKSNALDK